MQHHCKLTHFRKGNDNNVIQVSIVHDFLIHYKIHYTKSYNGKI